MAYYDSNGVSFSDNGKDLVHCPEDLSGSYSIPYGVEHIRIGAFKDCNKLLELTIPSSVSSIEMAAFNGVKSIRTIKYTGTLEDWLKVSHLGFLNRMHSLYIDGSQLVNIKIPDSISTIPSFAFYDVIGIDTVEFHKGVKSIGQASFNKSSIAGELSLPNGLESIGPFAFFSCIYLKSVIIPASVKTIGDKAFCYCSDLESIIVDTNNKNYLSIDGENLASKDGKILYATALGKYKKYGKDYTLKVYQGIETIKDEVFSDIPSNVCFIELPDTIRYIETNAFKGYNGQIRIHKKAIHIMDGVAFPKERIVVIDDENATTDDNNAADKLNSYPVLFSNACSLFNSAKKDIESVMGGDAKNRGPLSKEIQEKLGTAFMDAFNSMNYTDERDEKLNAFYLMSDILSIYSDPNLQYGFTMRRDELLKRMEIIPPKSCMKQDRAILETMLSWLIQKDIPSLCIRFYPVLGYLSEIRDILQCDQESVGDQYYQEEVDYIARTIGNGIMRIAGDTIKDGLVDGSDVSSNNLKHLSLAFSLCHSISSGFPLSEESLRKHKKLEGALALLLTRHGVTPPRTLLFEMCPETVLWEKAQRDKKIADEYLYIYGDRKEYAEKIKTLQSPSKDFPIEDHQHQYSDKEEYSNRKHTTDKRQKASPSKTKGPFVIIVWTLIIIVFAFFMFYLLR